VSSRGNLSSVWLPRKCRKRKEMKIKFRFLFSCFVFSATERRMTITTNFVLLYYLFVHLFGEACAIDWKRGAAGSRSYSIVNESGENWVLGRSSRSSLCRKRRVRAASSGRARSSSRRYFCPLVHRKLFALKINK
jgi:hypothetical protein